MLLKTELEFYKKNAEVWEDHVGEFVLIKGEETAGFFSTYADAINAGYEKFGLDPFLVKQVSIVEQVHFLPPIMRRADATLHTPD